MSGTQKAKDRLAEVESALEKVKQAKEKMA